MEYKRNEVWTTTKLKDKAIQIYKFANLRQLLTKAEFQCVYTKYNPNETMKLKLNKNLSLP